MKQTLLPTWSLSKRGSWFWPVEPVRPVRPDVDLLLSTWFVKRARGLTRDFFSSVHCIIRIFLIKGKGLAGLKRNVNWWFVFFSSDKDFSFSKANLVGWGNYHSRPRLGGTTSSYRRGEEIHGRSPCFVVLRYLPAPFTISQSFRSNLEWYSTCPNFMSNVDPGKWWVICWSFDSFFKKGVLCLEGSCHSTESQLGRPKLLTVCLSDFHVSALSSELRVFSCFLVLKTHVSTTWKTLLPMTAPMPAIKFKPKPIPLGVTSEKNYIYAPLTPSHLLRLRPSFAFARCTHNFQLLTHHLFYHQEFKSIVSQPGSTFYVRLLHMTSWNKAIFQLTTPVSAVRTIWVTAYTTNCKTQATFGCETTHLKPPLVWCCLKHDINWTCCERQQKHNVMGWKKMGPFSYLAML